MVCFSNKWDDEWLKYDYIGAHGIVKDSYIDPLAIIIKLAMVDSLSAEAAEVPTKLKFHETNNSDFYWIHLELSTIMRMEIFIA